MITKCFNRFSESGIFTDSFISQGSVIFKYDDWIEDEQYGWEILSIEDIMTLPFKDRSQFLRYSYDVDFGKTIGTFDWKNARHVSNFMNHSCNPNMMYDSNNAIIAKRDIYAGEELTIDYGNFIVNVDQDFVCNCGHEGCRRSIRKDDWKHLVYDYGNNFPVFMHIEIGKLLIQNLILKV